MTKKTTTAKKTSTASKKKKDAVIAAAVIETPEVTIDDLLDLELNALLADATTEAANDPGDALIDAVASADSDDEDLDLESLEAAATAESVKAQAYADQDADEADATAVPDDGSAPAAKSATTVAKLPRASRAAGAAASDVLRSVLSHDEILKVAMLSEGDTEHDALVDDLDATINSLAKKVGSKAVNLLRHHANPAKLEGYTKKGLDYLIKARTTNGPELTAHFQSLGYTIGTARSQANQVMSLFPAMKIAERTGKHLDIRSDSNLVSAYKSACAA